MSRRSTNGGRRNNPYDCSLDLHGMYSQEAMELVARMISSHPRSSILIIHGNGTGVLRKFVQQYLRENKLVKSYRTADGFDGGLGVTVVELNV